MKHVLIIGGYGTFGLRLAERLSDIAGLKITLAGRNLEKAKAALQNLSGCDTHYGILQLDRAGNLNAQITEIPNLIIDASGPFQNYLGEARFDVIRYALSHNCHYLDLSDDASFVEAWLGAKSLAAERYNAPHAIAREIWPTPRRHVCNRF